MPATASSAPSRVHRQFGGDRLWAVARQRSGSGRRPRVANAVLRVPGAATAGDPTPAGCPRHPRRTARPRAPARPGPLPRMHRQSTTTDRAVRMRRLGCVVRSHRAARGALARAHVRSAAVRLAASACAGRGRTRADRLRHLSRAKGLPPRRNRSSASRYGEPPRRRIAATAKNAAARRQLSIKCGIRAAPRRSDAPSPRERPATRSFPTKGLAP